jgi:hypothetical protein
MGQDRKIAPARIMREDDRRQLFIQRKMVMLPAPDPGNIVGPRAQCRKQRDCDSGPDCPAKLVRPTRNSLQQFDLSLRCRLDPNAF